MGDISIVPIHVAAHTQATAYAIGERRTYLFFPLGRIPDADYMDHSGGHIEGYVVDLMKSMDRINILLRGYESVFVKFRVSLRYYYDYMMPCNQRTARFK